MKILLRRSMTASVCSAALLTTMFAAHFSIAQTQTQTQTDDPMLKAMQAELEREKAQLLLPGMQRPYFIEYRLDDFSSFEAVANYGALTREEEGHQRVVRVTVRVGDYALDSSTGRGDGVAQLAPEDDDPVALRYALWTATDEAYKNALRAYSAKLAALQQFQSSRVEKDLSQEKPVVHIESLRKLEIDRKEWEKRIIDASGLYVTAPEVRTFADQVQYSTANVRAMVLNRYLVNTEGTVLRYGLSGYNNAISLGGQAPDGMRLARDNGSVAVSANDLESWPAFRKQVIDDLKSLDALSKAPLVDAEDYHGPVLFSGDAASDVMNRLFVSNVEADRPELGTNARTRGAYASSFKARVLPEFMSVVDNPLESKFQGRSLLGAYQVDDDGVPAQAVDIVTNGRLDNYLIGREPIKDFPSSNGHGRAAPGAPAHSRSGVMIFKSSHPVSPSELNKQLLGMAKEQKRNVYAVETMGGEAPRLLYLVHPDGSRQLVRGAVFDELDNRSLRSEIRAVGDDPYVNDSLGTLPQTTIVPSLLFGDIEVKRATEEQQKLPYYPPPPSAK
ncbi:metallopeptidase TldD-related protein [Edaphobacter modestus]|uniref:Putative Zn-dependent protease n=1 Tax=Edaphobacter modestus TaxID=388466 RepID=A0A4Q7YU73_9BACT|nr:metallopeptidase TldD-related protein [Edaphobacter modestus]RZU41158.1 putative Zn-dependent protease [Edaphobacter modestus]